VYKIVNRKKRIKIFLIDTLLRWFVTAGGLRKTEDRSRFNTPPGEIRKILAIRLAYIGDLVMTLPALAALKELFPGAEIHLLTSKRASQVVQGSPSVGKVIPYDAPWFYPEGMWGRKVREYFSMLRRLRKEAYDLVIDFRGDFRNILFLVRPVGAKHRVSYDITGGGYFLTSVAPYRRIKHRTDFHLDLVKFLGASGNGSRRERIGLTEPERQEGEKLLREAGLPPGSVLVGFCPGAREKLKEWGTVPFARLAELMMAHWNARIILFGSRADQATARSIKERCGADGIVDMTGRTTLRQLMACLSSLDLVVANDSAPMHLAAALDVPVVGIFGPSKAMETAPISSRAAVVEQYIPCRFSCDESRCHIQDDRACLRKITPVEVFSTCGDLLHYDRGKNMPAPEGRSA